jgi:predicted transcriptional regulator
MSDDSEFTIMEILYQAQNDGMKRVKQRDLAETVQLSVGMTNSILKRLLNRGWLAIRRINSRNVQYLITPKGIEELSCRTYRYFKRTIKDIMVFKESVEKVVSNAKKSGKRSVILIWKSDIDFVIEHTCERHGLAFLTSVDTHKTNDALTLFSEDFESSTSIKVKDSIFLRDFINIINRS